MVNLSLGIFLALAEVFPRTNCSQIKFISAIDYTRELDAASFPVCFFSANPPLAESAEPTGETGPPPTRRAEPARRSTRPGTQWWMKASSDSETAQAMEGIIESRGVRDP